jgi:hypothetical protein
MTGQLTSSFELGVGVQENDFLYNFDATLGSVLDDNHTYFYGGVRLQSYSIIPLHERRGSEDEYLGQTIKAYNIALFTGVSYNISLLKFKKESLYEGFGFFPEFRIYFSPLLPYVYTYKNDNEELIKLKSNKKSQFAYSVGGGFYLGNFDDFYIALKFEMNTIDMVESLRDLEANNDIHMFPKGKQYLITLQLLLR